ncbi:MAG: rRNA adenine N-6-methyltransferase family protein [Acidobacteriota bacterium]
MPKHHRPKLGQHFLTDTRYCSRIVDALGLRADELVVEIGPGRGAMTELLAARAGGVIAVEVDPGLANELQQKFEQVPKVEIVHADVLSVDLGAICPFTMFSDLRPAFGRWACWSSARLPTALSRSRARGTTAI